MRWVARALLAVSLSAQLQANSALYLSYEAWVLRQQQHDARLAAQPTPRLTQRLVQVPIERVAPLPQTKAAALAGPIQVNINRADVAELDAKLLGVGEKKAQAIVSYRQQHGLFKRPEDLQKVKGIGEKTFAKNKDRISVKDQLAH